MLQERLKTALLEEKRRLEHLYKVQGRLVDDEATLSVRIYSNGRKEYYVREQHGKNPRYAGAEEQARVEQLKLKRRVETEIRLRENNCKWLERLLKQYVDCDYEAVEAHLPMAYRGAFLPVVLADPEPREGSMLSQHQVGRALRTPRSSGSSQVARSDQSSAQSFGLAFTRSEMKRFRGETWYRTSFGLLVRSKSEVIIAEQLYGAGIPFYYERQKILMTRKDEPEIVYPDFTIPLTGRLFMETERETEKENVQSPYSSQGAHRPHRPQESQGSQEPQGVKGAQKSHGPRTTMLYWEHMGMMDREGYRNRATEKLDWYVYSGILPGRELILTMEADDGDLDVAAIRRIIEGIILPQVMGCTPSYGLASR